MSDKEKKIQMRMRHLRLLKKFLITVIFIIKDKMHDKIFFIVHQKLIKENQNRRLKKALQRG